MNNMYEKVSIEIIYLTDDVITSSINDAFDGVDDETSGWGG